MNFPRLVFRVLLLVTGEGGMLTTNNYKLYKKALKISDFGRDPNKTFG